MTTDDTTVPDPPNSPADTYEDRVLGCLLGTMAGDAYGVLRDTGGEPAAALADPGASPVSSATHLTLATVDGLVEALEWANDGVAADETACLWLAYLRWLVRQGGQLPAGAPAPPARWLDRQPDLLPVDQPDADTVAALLTGEMGYRARPLNPQAEGPGALMRSAPLGLIPRIPAGMVERLTVDAAALTHGSVTAKETAAAYSGLVRRLAIEGQGLDQALGGIDAEGSRGNAEVGYGGVGSPSAGGPTAAATLQEAVRAVRAGAASSSPREHLSAALALAVDPQRPGSSPVIAASLTGGIIGALHGTAALPPSYLTAPGLPAVVRTMARTLLSATTGS